MRPRIELSDRPRLVRRARIRFDRRTQQHLLLLPERALLLNATAASIVLFCTGSRNVAQICAEVAEVVEDADAPRVLADVLQFLEALRERRLLELLGRPS